MARSWRACYCRSTHNLSWSARMSDAAAFTDDSNAGTLRFSGSLSLAKLGDLPDRLAAYDGKVERLDLSGIKRIDTIGAWTIHRFAQKNGAAVEGLTDD